MTHPDPFATLLLLVMWAAIHRTFVDGCRRKPEPVVDGFTACDRRLMELK